MKGELTKAQRDVLFQLRLRPNGAFFREEDTKQAVLELADRLLVHDPHHQGNSLFTRITPAGLQALSQDPEDTP